MKLKIFALSLVIAASLLSCRKPKKCDDLNPTPVISCYQIFPKNTLTDSAALAFTIHRKTDIATAILASANNHKVDWLYWINNEATRCDSTPYLVDTIQPATQFPNVSITLPTTFTPNNDSVNDVFGTTILGNVYKYQLRINDRWGSLVFASENPQVAWDGDNQIGQNQPTGTYVFSLKTEFFGLDDGVLYKNSLQGNVTLLR